MSRTARTLPCCARHPGPRTLSHRRSTARASPTCSARWRATTPSSSCARSRRAVRTWQESSAGSRVCRQEAMMAPKRVVLAYSGGLDTSVAVKWIADEWGAEVVALSVDVGQTADDDWDTIRQRALAAGAVEAVVVDAKREFADDYVVPVIRANALYEGKYPLVSALSRPVISLHLVNAAREFGADAVAHGCTGKGNDQVRFEVSVRALAPDLDVLAPVRQWGMTREDAMAYAARFSIPISATRKNPYSIDQNLWGRAVECGAIEDPWAPPPDDVYEMTVRKATEPIEVVISFEEGLPVAVDGRALALHELILELNRMVGAYGWGRLDMVENRRVGIKSREIYEAPGALAL